jgi:tryptophan halogenase
MTVARAAADQRLFSEPGPSPEDMPCGTVGIVGGGTAGYLTALALRHRFPALDVTLLESSQIGVIAVGEATTPRLVEFLHGPNGIGLDIVEFHERVRPVWKLGVYYDWAPPDAPAFPWPFQYGNVADAVHHDGHLVDHCLGATLMHRARTPLVDVGDGQVLSMLSDVPFAYHLDNNSFVSYLQEVATRRGVQRHDVTIARVEVGDDPSTVDALIAEDGRRFEFDLYVDCSGFGSLLLEKGLGSSWIGYDDSLFCDAAVVADTPHDGVVRPYTAADTMDAGWCWRIAFDDADHRGYVFSSSFLDDDAAAAEMRTRNPDMGDHWVARFRSGRHGDWWLGNVVALGNAYGFVEPLASTALHLLVGGIDKLSDALTTNPGPVRKAALSAEMGTAWDNIRCWLATQYRFNRRLDTDFWRECHSSVALHEAAGRVERYMERAPLSARTSTGGGYFAYDYSYDVVLAGQQIPARWAAPRSTPAEWHAHTARLRSIADRALPHEAARELLRRRPDILLALQEDPEGWIQNPVY